MLQMAYLCSWCCGSGWFDWPQDSKLFGRSTLTSKSSTISLTHQPFNGSRMSYVTSGVRSAWCKEVCDVCLGKDTVGKNSWTLLDLRRYSRLLRMELRLYRYQAPYLCFDLRRPSQRAGVVLIPSGRKHPSFRLLVA